MEAVKLNRKSLDELAASSLSFGTELYAVEDQRMRVWVRKKGLVLGFEVHLNGKRVRKTIGRYGDITLTQFRDEFSKIMANLTLHGVADVALTVGDFFDGPYLRYSLANHKDQRSVMSNYRRLSIDIKNKHLDKVKREDIQMELQLLKNRGLSNSSVNRTRALLSGLFRLAEADGLITKSPVTHVPALYEQIQPAVALSDIVYSAYIEIALQPQYGVHGCALALAAITGARISEIRSILIDDIAFDRQSFVVRNTKNHDKRTLYLARIGTFALTKALGVASGKYLFSSALTETGFISYPRSTHKKIVNDLIGSGLLHKPFKVKDLRSTVGTKLYQETGSLEAVRRQLGHRTLSVPAKHYIHPSEEHSRMLTESLESLLCFGPEDLSWEIDRD